MKAGITVMLLLKRVDCNDGVAAYVESLVTGLREQGDHVVVVSGEVTTLYGSQTRRQSIRQAASEWIVLDGLMAPRRFAAHLRTILLLIRRYDVDVLSPQGFQVLPLASMAGRVSRRAVITNFHLLQDELSTKQRLAYRVVSTLFRSDRYLAMSHDIKTFFGEQCGIPKRLIHEQKLGVDTTFFHAPTEVQRAQARSRFGIDPQRFVAVLPGRLNRSKGHDIAAAAFRMLRVQRGDLATFCLFVGGGDERASIEAKTLRDDADRDMFRFLGFVGRETIRDAYWAADIVLLPSRAEGFPLVVCEAMCCGTIVIRTPSSGWQDQVIEGTTGYVVPFDDPVALAQALAKVADSPDREMMREAAMTLASARFSRAGMIAGTSALYRDLALAGRRRRREAGSPGSRLMRPS